MSEKFQIKMSGTLLAHHSSWYNYPKEFLGRYDAYRIDESGQYLIISQFDEYIDGKTYTAVVFHIYDSIDQIKKAGLYPAELVDGILWEQTN
jgi:hypothetical protein